MVKKLTLAVAMVALMALPAFAAVQNVKVGGDITTTSVIRNNMDGLGGSSTARENDILSQVDLKINADLTDNVSTAIKLTNERLWATAQTSSVVRLDTASVTMKELLYSPLTVTVGRQPLQYGNQLIIGDGDSTTDVSKVSDLTGGVNFDAIKAVLSYNPLTVDLFAARTANGATTTPYNGRNNANLYGANANYKLGDKMSTVVEGYVFMAEDNTGISATATDSNDTYTPGLRVSTNPIEGLNVQLEGAYQLGHVYVSGKQETIGAWATQAKVNYALPVLKDMKPVLSADFKYISGDKKSGVASNKVHAFYAPYQNQGVGRIYHAKGLDNNASNTGVGTQLATLSGEITPIKDLTTALSVSGIWAAEKTPATTTINSSLFEGNEVDLDLTYAYTEDVKFGVSAGEFFSGKATVNNNALTTNDHNATQLLSSVSVAF